MRPEDIDIYFLTFDDFCEIHTRALQEFGNGMDGFLSEHTVQSAAAQPQAGMTGSYFYEFPAGMAAAYLYFLTNQQGFLNGNKRTAVGAALEFLARNGFGLNVSNYDVYEATIRIAGEDVQREPADILADLKEWIDRRLVPL